MALFAAILSTMCVIQGYFRGGLCHSHVFVVFTLHVLPLLNCANDSGQSPSADAFMAHLSLLRSGLVCRRLPDVVVAWQYVC